MNARSLRFRLVTWYALWLVTVFAAAGTLLYFGLRHYLEVNLAETQQRRAERVALLVMRPDVTPDGNLAAEITTEFAPEASDRFVRVSRPDGRVVYQSGQPHGRSFDPAQIAAPPRRAGTRQEKQADGVELVLATVPAGPRTAPVYFVETGESLAPALTELRRLLFSLALGFALVTGVALGGGFLLVRRALRPVEEITRSAEGITSRNLGERLPVPPTGDEFEHLSRTLNGMITRLDEAFQHNRRFLADASHELRTPLTILRAELEAIVERDRLYAELQLPLELRATAGNLLEEVERLSRIVENLFALSRLEAGQAHGAHARFDLAKLAATTAEQMWLLAEDKKLTLSCDTPDPVLIDGDSARLKQVIVNLLDNAIKYTPAGGTVKLAVTTRAGEALFEVADTGIGIPAEAVPHVFDRFFRVDAARSREVGGAGIGLSIVKAICTAHGACVEVESELGRGSCFRVRLALSDKQHPSSLPL
jgi:heavy metal sensor kinase